MVRIKEVDGKLVFYGFSEPNEEVEFKAEDVPAAVATFKNVLHKLERYTRANVGWEHIKWIGFYKLTTDENMEKARAIFDKYNDLIDKELEILNKDAYDKMEVLLKKEREKENGST